MILSRPEWGAIPMRVDTEFAPIERERIQFLTVHRDVGDGLGLVEGMEHSTCPSILRAAQLRDQGYGKVDLRWNFVACPHGQLYDVRGYWFSAETRMPEVDRVSLAIAHLGMVDPEVPGGGPGMAAIFGYWQFLKALFPGIGVAVHRGWDSGVDCPGGDITEIVDGWVRADRMGRVGG